MERVPAARAAVLSSVVMHMRRLTLLLALLIAAAPVAPVWAARVAECSCGGGSALCRCCAPFQAAPGEHSTAQSPHRCPCTEPVDAPAPKPFTAMLPPEAPHSSDFGLPPHAPLGALIPAGAPGPDLIPSCGLPPPLRAPLPILLCSFLC